MDQNRATAVGISLMTFVRLFLIVLGILLLWALRDIIILLFLAMILAAAIGPWITSLSKRGIPRPLGMLIIYSGIVAIIVAVVLLLIPAVARETTSLAARFPDFYDRVTEFFNRNGDSSSTISAAKDNLSMLTRGVFAGLKGVLGGFAMFLLVLVITFYFTVDEANLRRFWIRLAPVSYQERITRITQAAGERIGNWFRGQLVISAVIASVSYFLLTLLDVPDALLLAIIAGVAAFVPFIGAAIGIIPAVFVALTVSLTTALIVLAVSIALYQLVANALVPRLMSRAVGLNPVIIILVMFIGADLAGAVGLILAIPITSVVDVIIREFGPRKGEAHA